jgi:chromosome partitioning protein
MTYQEPPWEGPPLIISVFGGKGGIGKTTLAFLLAWLLGQVGPTLLIDADKRQEDGSTKELYDKLTVESTFDISVEEDPTLLGGLRNARGYRFIVVDNAPHRDPAKLEASCNGDLIVVPMVPVYLEIRAVMSSLRNIVIPSGRPYRVVMSRVTNNRKSKARTTHVSLEAVGIPVFKTHMREYVAHQDAGALGLPVTSGQGANWDKAAQDAFDLTDEVLEALGQTDRVPRKAAA